MPDFLYNWPLWISGLLLTAVLVAAAVVTVFVGRRRFESHIPGHGEGEFLATMVHSMMVLYALVAALIAVGVWEKHAEIESAVTREASSLLALYRDASGYPEPVRTQLQGAIRAYTEQIIHEAWPQQRRGMVPSGGVTMVDRIQDPLLVFEPATDGQKLLHAETLRAYNVMVDARRQRLDANHVRLPGIIWMVDIVGALVCFVGVALFRVNRFGLHALSAALLAVLIGMILLMTLALERPYRSSIGIGVESYELAHDQVMVSPGHQGEHAR